MAQNTIACELHDYIEVACMYGYQLKLVLKDGQVVEGRAVDIEQSTDKHEWLVISNGETRKVDLITLAKMQVLTPQAKFTEVVF